MLYYLALFIKRDNLWIFVQKFSYPRNWQQHLWFRKHVEQYEGNRCAKLEINEIFLAAVQQNGYALAEVAPALQGKEDIVLAAAQ